MGISISIANISAILLIGVGMYISMALISFFNRKVEGALCYAVLLLAASIYSLGYYFELRSETLEIAFNWLRFEYIGIALIPVSWLVFTIKYSGYSSFLSKRLIALIMTIPVMTIVIINTNNFHHLFYASLSIEYIEGFSFVSTQKGIWYWVHIIHMNTAIIIGNILLLYTYIKSKDAYNLNSLTNITM